MTLKLFLKPPPAGNDSNHGLIPSSPINTLAKANQLCHKYAPNHDRDVVVKVAPGLYRNQTVQWDYYSSDFRVIIFGTDVGLPTTVQGMPNFRGPADGQTWFNLPNTRIGESSNLMIKGLYVNQYRTAINTEGSNGNVISGCYFRRIGQQEQGGRISHATIRLKNSNENLIEKCFFRINGNFYSDNPQDWVKFHGIYMAHHANKNTIVANNFSRLSGHPIKIRDSSNGNVISGNRFFNVRMGTAVQDYYKNGIGEAPSFDNVFSENEVLSNGPDKLIAVEVWYRVFCCNENLRRKHRIFVENNFGNPHANEVLFDPKD